MDWESRSAISSSTEGEGELAEVEAKAKAKAKAVAPPDRMVKIEMEAAEALADLAHLAAGGTESGSRSRNRSRSSSGGKVAGRARKRVKTESSLSHSGLNLVDLSLSRPDLAQGDGNWNPIFQSLRRRWSLSYVQAQPDLRSKDSAVLSLPQHEKSRDNSMSNRAKSEQQAQPSNQSRVSTTGHVFLGGGRSRQNLSEAEKEAKRLRRVLANRESARRTIRRRQALCEELTRKAAELTEENEKLIKGKEAALRELQMLETRNKQLKAKMAKAVKCEVVGTTSEIMPASGEMPASSLNFLMLLHNNPLAPVVWPPIFQSPSTGQAHQVPPTLPFIPANVTTEASFKPHPPHERGPLNISGPRTPVYILPCPWFFPFPNQVHHFESSHCPKSDRGDKPVDDQHGATSTRTAVSSENCDSSFPASAETEAPGPIRLGLLNDLNQIPVESPVDQGCQQVGLQCEEAASEPKQASFMGTETVRHEIESEPHPANGTNVVEAPSSAGLTTLSVEHRESVTASGDKKLISMNAAAEARRRRKERTKLKAMHGRQY
ncbi:uncharacterized protein LOC116197558 isoform X1 [Punica granatum]|uniref:Uncharacterized protein LOC116197558 isoform X1 n=1 Tax=Punica granatum TaxID=22663 RepID=A0A6P8CJX8_PUNGR|nr:uncharacterized protein LOC116197558 isoform X1 [Punica granatum]